MFGKKDSVDKGLPFGLTRFLSWISLILILASSVMLAFFIGNSARNTLLLRQQQYAMLMASNLNQQIYRRFTLPTFLAFGRIALRQSMQYEELVDEVQSTILGLHLWGRQGRQLLHQSNGTGPDRHHARVDGTRHEFGHPLL